MKMEVWWCLKSVCRLSLFTFCCKLIAHSYSFMYIHYCSLLQKLPENKNMEVRPQTSFYINVDFLKSHRKFSRESMAQNCSKTLFKTWGQQTEQLFSSCLYGPLRMESSSLIFTGFSIDSCFIFIVYVFLSFFPFFFFFFLVGCSVIWDWWPRFFVLFFYCAMFIQICSLHSFHRKDYIIR